METLQYNTKREQLIIPEYGRHVQLMINQILETQDREERNKMAKAVIGIMGNMNPHLRDVPDFQHKLWDQLFIMSDFQLDVDSPFERPQKEVFEQKPERLNYPQKNPKYRFYGNNIKRMIDVAIKWEDGDKKDGLVITIANHMKKSFLNWNKDTVEDQVIFNHLFELSDGKINLKNSEEDLTQATDLIKTKKRFVKKTHKQGRGRKRY